MIAAQETIVIRQSFQLGSTCIVRECRTDDKGVKLDGYKVMDAAIAFFRAAHDKFEFNGAGEKLYKREVEQAVHEFLKSDDKEGRIKDALYDKTGHPHFFDLSLERMPFDISE